MSHPVFKLHTHLLCIRSNGLIFFVSDFTYNNASVITNHGIYLDKYYVLLHKESTFSFYILTYITMFLFYILLNCALIIPNVFKNDQTQSTLSFYSR